MPTYAKSLKTSKENALNKSPLTAIECPKIILRNGTVSTREQIKLAYKDRAYLYIDRRPQYLSTASFSCSSGFTLVGHSVATCMANSKWNVPLPKCTAESLHTGLVRYN